MKKKKRMFSWVILVLFVAACTQEGEATPTANTAVPASNSTTEATTNNLSTTADGEQETLLFAVYDWEMGRYEELAKSFSLANPGIHVELVSINETLGLESFGGSDWPEDANIRLASAADVISHDNMREAAQQGVLLDLTPFFERDNHISTDDFYPEMLNALRWDGGLWALPTSANFSLIFFNKDAFDAANITYPQPGWSWDDFLIIAQALTIREGDQVTQWGYVERESAAAQIVQGLAGTLVDETVAPPEVRLVDTAVQDAVTWYTDLFLRHEVAPLPASSDSNSTTPPGDQLIENGQAAMWIDFDNSFAVRSQQANLGVVPFPIGSNNQNSTPTRLPHNLAISAGTNKAEAAWQWLLYLSGQAHEDNVLNLPARRSVLEASGLGDNINPELRAALTFAAEHPLVTMAATRSHAAFRQAISAILAGEQTIVDALAEAQAQMETDQDETLAMLEEVDPADIVVAEPEESEPALDAATLTFIAGGALELQAYRALALQFQAAHPGVVVEVRQPAFTNSTITFTDIAADSDCFSWSPPLDKEENLAAILNLDPFFDNDPTIRQDDFFPAVLGDFTYQGQIWGIPDQVMVTVVEYNKALFDKANVPYPTPNWTMEDFLTTAVALTSGNDAEKQYGFVPETFELQDMIPFIERQGAQLVDDSIDPPTFGFDDPATVEAVRWFTNLTTEHSVKPVFTTNITTSTDISRFDERQALIDNGQAAMWTNSSSSSLILLPSSEDETADPNIGTVPLPVGLNGERLGGYQSTSGFFISAHTEVRQACWEWIKFLSDNSSEILVDWFLPVLPARISAAESANYTRLVGQERAAAYQASIMSATQPSYFERFSSESTWLSRSYVWLAKAYDQILHENSPAEEALAVAQATAESYRACIIDSVAFTDEEAQEACLHEADPSLPDNFVGPVRIIRMPGN